MPLPLPNLDDRRFEDLVAEAKSRAAQAFPAWNDLSPHDPGIVLIEAFAHLTELMLYRLNRVPDKAYVAFLNLMGVTLYPPVAATTDLTFTRKDGFAGPIVIPAGTRVTTASPGGSGGPPAVFRTVRDQTLIDGNASLTGVRAVNAETVEGELAGRGTGLPSQVVRVAKAPIIAPIGDEMDLIVRVEIDSADAGRGAAGRGTDVWFNGKVFRQWAETDQFGSDLDDPSAYVVDRNTGTISFSPQVRWSGPDGLAPAPGDRPVVPPVGREIRVWYRFGGGARGNVKEGALGTLVDKIAGIGAVTNEKVAAGGHDAETLENARVRGPQQIHSLDRAVTARDYEFLARRLNPGTVSRAKAMALKTLWEHARPGVVGVLLVPDLPAADRTSTRVTADLLKARQTDAACQQIFEGLNARKPIGTELKVDWVRYKTVSVTANLVVQRGADGSAIKSRVENALYRLINPLPTPAANGSSGVPATTGGRLPVDAPGWPFGDSVRASHVYDIALAEPGVNYVENVSFKVADSPSDSVSSLAADAFQPRTFYAGSADTIYRSVNNGDGWEPLRQFPGETVYLVEAHPEAAGWLAVGTNITANGQTAIYFSDDCGETWKPRRAIDHIQDMAWMLRSTGEVVLLVVDQRTLYSMTINDQPRPIDLTADMKSPPGGYWSVAACTDSKGRVTIAVATDKLGIYISRDGGNSFKLAGSGMKQDIHYVTIQPGAILWAGLSVDGRDPGGGAFAFDLNDDTAGVDWKPRKDGWKNFGTCKGLAFDDQQVYAATYRGGVVRLNLNDKAPAWQPMPSLQSLPRVDLADNAGDFRPITGVAFNAVEAQNAPPDQVAPLLASGQDGLFRSVTQGVSFDYLFKTADLKPLDFKLVTLPETWLFCSGSHVVTAVTQDATR